MMHDKTSLTENADDTHDTAQTSQITPCLFISHGAPSLVIDDCPARDFLRHELPQFLADKMGQEPPRPKGILVISAHWDTHAPTITAANAPSTIHDFGGFPAELYDITYPATGSPALAQNIADSLAAHNIKARLDHKRGLDHGAWVPLSLLYPSPPADMPIVQLSIQMDASPADHFAMGQAIAPLREQGIMIIASGSITHNLRAAFTSPLPPDTAPKWVDDFNEWIFNQIMMTNNDDPAIVQKALAALMAYNIPAPHGPGHIDGQKNHPSPDHILPLFVALGAAYPYQKHAARLHHSYTFSVISMDTYFLG